MGWESKSNGGIKAKERKRREERTEKKDREGRKEREEHRRHNSIFTKFFTIIKRHDIFYWFCGEFFTFVWLVYTVQFCIDTWKFSNESFRK